MVPPPDYEGRNPVTDEYRQTLAKSPRRNGPQEKARRVRNGMDYFIDLLRLLLTLAALGFVLLIIDGIRREHEEFEAQLTHFKPKCNVRRFDQDLPLLLNMPLETYDKLTTASDGAMTMTFPDGGAIVVDPSTNFQVQMLDFTRGPKRQRSFLLTGGSVFVRIGKLFGDKGQELICTPSAIAAGHSAGFAVSYNADTKTTVVQVVDGKVALRTAGGRIEISEGGKGTAVGNEAPTLGTLSHSQDLTARFNGLTNLDPPTPPIVQFERDMLTTADPALEYLALTPRGFTPGDNDWSRRAATKQSMQTLQQGFEALNGEIPDALNPITLSELNLAIPDRDRILNSFAGHVLDRYEKTGQGSFRAIARSRDSAGTVFEVTEAGVRQVP